MSEKHVLVLIATRGKDVLRRHVSQDRDLHGF